MLIYFSLLGAVSIILLPVSSTLKMEVYLFSEMLLTYRWHTGFGWGKLRARDDLEDLGADGRILLKWIFKKGNGEA
jgi:hypothetical protein